MPHQVPTRVRADQLGLVQPLACSPSLHLVQGYLRSALTVCMRPRPVRPRGKEAGAATGAHAASHAGPNQPSSSLGLMHSSTGVSPVHNCRVAIASCDVSHYPIPRAAIHTSPLEHGQVPTLGCTTTRAHIPRAAIRPSPLQHDQVPTLGCTSARALFSRAAIRPSPLEHGQVATLSCA
jgi:hypothetical protein